MERILVAMSGGVDSSVAALLLARQENCVVEGAYMKNWINEENIAGDCPWQQDIEDARAVAETIGIPFRIINLMEAYRSRVVDYLLEGYQSGITPNPDVMCNREIKFGAFLETARAQGFDAVATGHYARRLPAAGERGWELHEGLDPNKDQSYFLALLRQDQLARARFPIGELTKPEVRRLAREAALPTSEKKDSQGICFIGQVRMSDFLRAYLPDVPGAIRTTDGRVVGEHRGLHLYTLGQRRGLGVPSNTPNQAYVVVEKDAANNTLVVAFDEPGSPGLYTQSWQVGALSFIGQPLSGRTNLWIRPRYRARPVPARFEPGESPQTCRVHFEDPQRAITPGQICAFYEDRKLLGGGIFQHSLQEVA